MTYENLAYLYSKDRCGGLLHDDEHRLNFKLIKSISDKLGAVEIITRNKIAGILGVSDSVFISRQTLGYWIAELNEARIHNKVADFTDIDFLDYSIFNKKHNWLRFQKVRICYSLILAIRNRAFHFENLFKLNENGTPRISTNLHGQIIGIEPQKIETFLNDVLKCFDRDLIEYLEGGG